MDVKISVVIPTYNRTEYLRKAIKSLIDQTLPMDQYEILVIDNCSVDNTRKVVCEEFKNVRNLRYIYEPRLGLTYARNAGWQNATGEYIAYLDDDAVASRQWLEKILEVFETVKPQPGCVGGKIEPIWEAPRPSWLSDSKLGDLAILNWSNKPVVLNKKQWVAGANMSLPRKILEKVNGFQPGFGRASDKLFTGEDILLERKLAQMGYHCFYHPDILVWHHVPSSRLTKYWFIKRAYWQGVADASIQIHEESPSVSWRLLKGMTTLLRILLSPRELFCSLAPTNNPRCFHLKCSVLARAGHVLRLWGLVE
jgi:glycosyltransferase involved in cell wall biosynthesis